MHRRHAREVEINVWMFRPGLCKQFARGNHCRRNFDRLVDSRQLHVHVHCRDSRVSRYQSIAQHRLREGRSLDSREIFRAQSDCVADQIRNN